MAKTKDKRLAARQAERIRTQHSNIVTNQAMRQPNPELRRALQKKRQRSGFAALISEFPVATGLLVAALIISFFTITYSNHTLFFAPSTKAVDSCGWATKPNTINATNPITRSYSKAPVTCITANTPGTYTATIHTTRGAISLVLDQQQTPVTVNNFIFLASHHFYDGLTFHRIVADFVAQTGDPRSANPTFDTTKPAAKGEDGPGYTIKDEFFTNPGKFFNAGCVAMANKGLGTTGSQFFICTADDTTRLNASSANGTGQIPYNRFGTVYAGLDIAKALLSTDLITSITIQLDPQGVPGVYSPPATPTVAATATATK